MKLEKDSRLNIYSSFTLSSDDIHCLSLLYVPLIGNDALSLYMGFTSLLERNNLKSETMIHQDLYDIFGINEKKFLQARLKLEAIGLILSYNNELNEYIYVLKAPLTPKTFLADGTLGLYLYGIVGEKSFNYLLKHFEIEKIDKKLYTNITVNFDDVFKSEIPYDKPLSDKYSYLLGRLPNISTIIGKHAFDYDAFIKKIDQTHVNQSEVSKFKRSIVGTSFVYGFDEDQMANIYRDSINKLGEFDYKLLKKKANTLFVYLNNVKAPVLSLKESADDKNELQRFLDNITAEDLLNTTLKKCPSDYLITINDIYSQIELPRGVLNCMIMNVLKEKGGELPSLAYFKKVAESWVINGIITTQGAIDFSYNRNTKVKTSNNMKKKKDDPEWVDNYLKTDGGFDEL